MKKKGNFRKVVSGLLAGMTMLSTVPVSYTHLDVYKRQPVYQSDGSEPELFIGR